MLIFICLSLYVNICKYLYKFVYYSLYIIYYNIYYSLYIIHYNYILYIIHFILFIIIKYYILLIIYYSLIAIVPLYTWNEHRNLRLQFFGYVESFTFYE